MEGDDSTQTLAPSTKRPASETAESTKLKQSKYADQRKDLGASFGTRKAQKVQKARDSNIIDTTNIGNVLGCLVETINESTKSVPAKEVVEAKQNAMRPIPPYNLQAETAVDVYPLDELILPAEVAAMKPQVSAIKKSEEENGRKTLLAYRSSIYLNNRLSRLFETEGVKPNSKRIRIIYFASLLMALYLNRRLVGNREKLATKLCNPPDALIDSLVARFSERNTIDNRNADRILTHLFVLGLHLDNFATELRALQEDLQLRPPQIATLYRELGCNVAPITETQRVAAGLTKAEAKSLKRAVLKVPLTFPPPKRGPAKR